MITFKLKGDFSKLNSFFEKCTEIIKLGDLNKYGRMGVEALSNNTPIDTGLLSKSWYYEIIRDNNGVKIVWSNSDVENGYNVAILVQYGHGTKSGGFVEGVDFINPAMEPIFNEIIQNLMKEV